MQQEPAQKQPVIVAGKDVKEVDNDYFLIPVKIMDHEGPFSANFPVENRLLPQGKSDACLQLYALSTHQQHTSAAAQEIANIVGCCGIVTGHVTHAHKQLLHWVQV